MIPIEKLLANLPDAKQTPNGWQAQCPAHKDQRPSLSISEGDDGRVLVNCFAGCATADICAAVGLELLDLMPRGDTLLPPKKSSRKVGRSPRPKLLFTS